MDTSRRRRQPSSIALHLGRARALVPLAMLVSLAAVVVEASNPVGMSFSIPGTLRHGERYVVATSIGGGSEGAVPETDGIQVSRGWFPRYGWSGYPCFVDGEIQTYQGISCNGPYCLSCGWSSGHEFSDTWYGAPVFEFLVTGCGEGSIRIRYLDGNHGGPYYTDTKYFRIVGGADAEFTMPLTGDVICPRQDVLFEFTGCGDVVLWDFGDGTGTSGDEVTHAYDEPGSYQVRVTAHTGGEVSTTTQLVTIGACGVILGAVTGSDTIEPLVGASVWATGPAGDFRDRANPPGGVYFIRVPEDASYDVTAAFPGYQSRSQSVYVPPDQVNPAVVDFVLNPDTEPIDDEHELGDQVTNEDDPVNPATGNLYLAKTVVQVPSSATLGFELVLSYNSLAATAAGPVGFGWTHSYDVSATVGDLATTVRYADGHSQRWARASDGDPWVPVGGPTESALEDLGDGVRLKVGPSSTWDFAADGRLAAVTDSAGAALTLAYSTRLDAITDPAGRQFDFVYDPSGRLTAVRCAALGPDDLAALSYDVTGNLVTLTDPIGHSWVFGYDGSHRLVSETDRRGHQVLLVTYDGAGRVATEADAHGRVTSFDYAAVGGGLETTITPPSGRAVRHLYNGSGQLVKVVDGLGHVARFGYDGWRLAVATDKLGRTLELEHDAEGRMVAVEDRRGERTQLEWDVNGRPTKIVGASGTEQLIGYYASGRPVYVTGPNGEELRLAYDGGGRLASVRNPTDQGTWDFTYTPSGQLETITDRDGNAKTLAYDAAGRLSGVTMPAGLGSWSFERDLAGNLVSTTTPAGRTTSFTYDETGNVRTRTFEATNAVTTYSYDVANQLTAIRDAYGAEETYGWDEDGHLVTSADADGVTTIFEYDDRGHLAAVVAPSGGRAVITSDANGNVVATTDAAGNTRTAEFDEEGAILSVTDPLGYETRVERLDSGRRIDVVDPLGRRSSTSVDAVGDARSVRGPDGAETVFERDLKSRLIAVTDPNGGTWEYHYDRSNRLLSATGPDGLSERFEYDEVGRKTRAVLRNGTEISYAWDADDNLTSMTLPGGETLTYSSSYDASGELLSATSSAGTVTDRLDLMGRPVEHVGVFGTAVGYDRTPAGRLDAVTYPGNLVADYRYDAFGRLERIVDWQGNETVFIYDVLDRVVAVELPGGVRTDTEYDPRGLVTRIHHTGPGGANLFDLRIERDALGRIASVERIGALQGSLDDRATGMVRDAGQRLRSTSTAGVVEPASHDADGNLERASGVMLGWDSLSRPISAERDGVTASFTYGPRGTRVEKTEDGVTTRYLWDGSRLVATLDGAGVPLLRHVTVGNQVLYSVEAGGGVRVYLPDERGNVVAVTDGAGAVVASYAYDAFGATIATTGALADNELRFGGSLGVLTDATGLVYMRARVYDPRLRQFLSEDPLGVAVTGNLYSYAGGDPANAADPLGLQATLIHNQLYDFVKTWVSEGWERGWREAGTFGNVVLPETVNEVGLDPDLLGGMTRIGSTYETGQDVYLLSDQAVVTVAEAEGIDLVNQTVYEIRMETGGTFGGVNGLVRTNARPGFEGQGTLNCNGIWNWSGPSPGAAPSSQTLTQGPGIPRLLDTIKNGVKSFGRNLKNEVGEIIAGVGLQYTIGKVVLTAGLEDLAALGGGGLIGYAGPVTVAGVVGGVGGWLIGRGVGNLPVVYDPSRGCWITVDQSIVDLLSPYMQTFTPEDPDLFLMQVLHDNGISYDTYLKWERESRPVQ